MIVPIVGIVVIIVGIVGIVGIIVGEVVCSVGDVGCVGCVSSAFTALTCKPQAKTTAHRTAKIALITGLIVNFMVFSLVSSIKIQISDNIYCLLSPLATN